MKIKFEGRSLKLPFRYNDFKKIIDFIYVKQVKALSQITFLLE